MWVQLHPTIYEQVPIAAGRATCPSVVIMDAQSVKTTERGGTRGFDAHKRGRGRKRHILVDTLGLPIASRVEPADTSDRRGGARWVAGLAPLFPRIHTVIADAGHESRKLARERMCQDGWTLQIVNAGSAPSRSLGLPGSLSAASLGLAGIVGSAKTTNIACRRPS